MVTNDINISFPDGTTRNTENDNENSFISSYRLISSSTDAYCFSKVPLNKTHGAFNCTLNVGAELMHTKRRQRARKAFIVNIELICSKITVKKNEFSNDLYTLFSSSPFSSADKTSATVALSINFQSVNVY